MSKHLGEDKEDIRLPLPPQFPLKPRSIKETLIRNSRRIKTI